MKKIFFSLLIAGAWGFAACSGTDPNPVLTVEGGNIQGVETETPGIIAYKGVPYAAPPVGDLRWVEPQPVESWEGVKVANAYDDACSQVTWDPDSFYGKEWQASGSVPFTEDCLYLNVWTPAAGKIDKKLPVAMWIHGGGYREGFAFEPEMDGGEDYASRGVILVTVSYRLGVMGFFSHPLLSEESAHGVSGNYGLMDQAAALKWISENIEQFGGDPENITIVGQSAGAGSVQSLLASPVSQDLISQAISMSGGGLSTGRMGGLPLATAEENNQKMMDHFGKTTLDDMRALSFDELLEMASEYAEATNSRAFWGPVNDSYFLPKGFAQAATDGDIPDIPYMFGFTSNDLGDMTAPIQDFCALRDEQSEEPCYAYLFQRQLPGDESGAFHSADLWYIFHSMQHSWRPFTEGDKALSSQMVDYWTNFAKYGNPNGATAGVWTPYTAASPEFLLMDADENAPVLEMSDAPQYAGSSFRWR